MKKNIVGIFATSFEAMKAIDSLRHDGIDNDHIYVIANDVLMSDTIEEKTGVTVKDGRQHTERYDNFWKELKFFFTNEDTEPRKYSDLLLDLGVTETDVARYVSELENGRILVLVDSHVDRGRTETLSTENMPLNNTDNIKIHGEKVDNFTMGDRFDRDKHSLNGRLHAISRKDSERQAGRPKEREAGIVSRGRKREYEEEVNPFENRYTSGYSGQNLDNSGNEQPDY